MSAIKRPSTKSDVVEASVMEKEKGVLMLEEMAEEDHHVHCLICYDDLKYRVLLKCNHNDICPVCMLRLRYLHKDNRCPICKQESEQTIAEETSQQQYNSLAEYPIWGSELGSDFYYLSDVATFYRMDYYQNVIRPLLSYSCSNCNQFDITNINQNNQNNNNNEKEDHDDNNNHPDEDHPQEHFTTENKALRMLQNHLKRAHRLQLCFLCADFRRDFVANLPRYTRAQLQRHFQWGGEDGSKSSSSMLGHPVCEFCRPKRFYDMTQLHLHCNQEHYKCDLCNEMGLPNQFFKHYPSLQRHFDQQHFLCQHPSCLEARFIVFQSELDLIHHQRQVHGTLYDHRSTKIVSLQFRYTSTTSNSLEQQTVPSQQDFDYTLDGQAFVLSDLPRPRNTQDNNGDNNDQNNNNDVAIVDPTHRARTAILRQRAAQVAQERGLLPPQPEQFPSLIPSADASTDPSNNLRLRPGWSSGTTIQRVAALPPTMPSARQPASVVAKEQFPSLPKSSRAATSVTRIANRSTAISQPSAALADGWGKVAAKSSVSIISPSPLQHPLPKVGTATGAAAPPVAVKQAPKPPNLSSSEQFPSLARKKQDVKTFETKPKQGQPQQQQQKPTQSYAAAEAFVRQQRQSSQQTSSSVNPLSSLLPNVKSTQRNVAQSQAQMNTIEPPQLNDPLHFPSSLGGVKDAKTVIHELKLALGKDKYQQLKQWTAEFAEGHLDGIVYVDNMAALFQQNDEVLLWSHVPALIESCPTSNGAQKTKALHYLDNLRHSRISKKNPQSPSSNHVPAAGASIPPGWSAPPSSLQAATTTAVGTVPNNNSVWQTGNVAEKAKLSNKPKKTK